LREERKSPPTLSALSQGAIRELAQGKRALPRNV
jgi:hypothetical protein